MSESMRRVLIVDDEPNIVTALEFLFRRSDYEVKVASTGDEALLAIDSDRPDVVLMDVMMPGRNGYEVCQAIRERPELAGIKIVMLSTRGNDAEISKGLSLGADLYVTKPFSTQELVGSVDRLLRSPEPPRR